MNLHRTQAGIEHLRAGILDTQYSTVQIQTRLHLLDSRPSWLHVQATLLHLHVEIDLALFGCCPLEQGSLVVEYRQRYLTLYFRVRQPVTQPGRKGRRQGRQIGLVDISPRVLQGHLQ